MSHPLAARLKRDRRIIRVRGGRAEDTRVADTKSKTNAMLKPARC